MRSLSIHSCKPLSARAPQTGSALIIALIMLLLMTLIGVTAMQTTVMQERMAGNTRDRQLAFEAAEASLRAAEQFLGTSAVVGPFNGTNGLFQPVASGAPRWEIVDWNSAQVVSVPFSVVGAQLASDPAYIIEELAVATDPEGSLAADEAFSEIRNYRITTQGWGGSDAAIVRLQTVFRRQ
jgi:type IV pilus assembly protein PilX